MRVFDLLNREMFHPENREMSVDRERQELQDHKD
jgi:hypothetical protein